VCARGVCPLGNNEKMCACVQVVGSIRVRDSGEAIKDVSVALKITPTKITKNLCV